jgi:hypothetical protein
MTKEQTIELNLLIAIFRCFNEQLYNLKGVHSKVVKMKFNRLLRTADQYEKEIINWTNNDDIDIVYDNMMDLIIEVKKQVLEDEK